MDYGNPTYLDRLETAAEVVLIPNGKTITDVEGAIYDLVNVSSSPSDLAQDLTGHPSKQQVDNVKAYTAEEIRAAGGDENAVAQANAAIDASIQQTGGTAEQVEANVGSSLKIFGLSVVTIIVLVLVFLILFELKK